LTKDFIPNAEGSALAELGNTKVLAGVKIDVAEPFKDRPDEGVISVNAEFRTMAHPEFEPGPPGENSIELARVVDRGIRSAECVDLKKLVLPDGKCLGIFVDVYILDHSGNLIDCAALAAMKALLHTRVPKYEGEKLVREETDRMLEIQRRAVSCSFEKIGSKVILDANEEEELASDGRLTLATCGSGLLCAGQKSGKAGFKKDELLQLADVALEKGDELRKLL
jgi:exosome complex component RRP42